MEPKTLTNLTRENQVNDWETVHSSPSTAGPVPETRPVEAPAKRGTPVLEVEGLVVEYGKGRKRQRAVDGISFRVEPGETVGFIGPNGAGKTSTMKAIMGFLFPASGSVRIFGEEAGSVGSRRRIGYLPEVALYYPFMKARELLELYGGLSEIDRRTLKARIPEVLDLVGLSGKGEILLRNFSKGMQQRLGIAQAIIADPEALVFDELNSGLDPVGRHDLRAVLLDLKNRGRTIFFSSHELNEVEALCDRVIMINRGRIVLKRTVSDLLRPLNRFEIIFRLSEGENPDAVVHELAPVERITEGYRICVDNPESYSVILQLLTEARAKIVSTHSHQQSLEDYFMSLVRPRAVRVE